MASYRFCRSDDVAVLVEAHNLCYLPHAPGEPALTIERFRLLARELDLWTSSCMLARQDQTPMGLLLATKRESEALVWRIAIRPGFERQGHGRHLLTSLSQKLAILGPRRIVAEIPAALAGACSFFEACGFRREVVLTDFVLRRQPEPESAQASALVIPVTLDELVANDAFDREARRCWARSAKSLLARGDRIRGEAISSGERLEAWLLYEDEETATAGPRRSILAYDAADPTRGALWLDVLLRRCVRSAAGAVILERATPAESGLAALEPLGFVPSGETITFVGEPRPA